MDNQITLNTDGDMFLSSYVKSMWYIHLKVMQLFNCYTIFIHTRSDASKMRDGYLEWFVPRNNCKHDDVIKYLEIELGRYCRERQDNYPGMNVTIRSYKGEIYGSDVSSGELY